MENLKEKMGVDIEEYGSLHENLCACNMEDPDICDCEAMSIIKTFTQKWMEEVNKYWIEMAKAHRPHCTPEGNKILTRMMGKKNRNLK